MFGLSFWEIAVVALVALVVLGPKRLPGVLKTLGEGLRSLRRASSEIRSALDEPLREVREPLEEIRNDLYQTVHNIEQRVEAAAAEPVDEQPTPPPAVEQDSEATSSDSERADTAAGLGSSGGEDAGALVASATTPGDQVGSDEATGDALQTDGQGRVAQVGGPQALALGTEISTREGPLGPEHWTAPWDDDADDGTGQQAPLPAASSKNTPEVSS